MFIFLDIDECSPNPCQHDGQCAQTFNASYLCGCAAGYTGVNCSDGTFFMYYLCNFAHSTQP